MTIDIINFLSATDLPERSLRPQAVENAQKSFEALLEGDLPERYAVAAFVAGLHRSSAFEFYSDLLADENPELVPVVAHAVEVALAVMGQGPAPAGVSAWVSTQGLAGLSARLVAAFDYAHDMVFHPVDATAEGLAPLAQVFSASEVVTLAQLVAFLTFQLRVVQGLSVVGAHYSQDAGSQAQRYEPVPSGASDAAANKAVASSAKRQASGLTGGVFDLMTYPDIVPPTRFVHHSLGWKPWVPAPSKDQLSPEQVQAMIRPERVGSAYFRLLSLNPAALEARTLTDLDIFYNVSGGLGRAERELAATVVSRMNGCIFCASVHAGRTLEESTGRLGDVERLLDQGAEADLGSALWNAIGEAARALTQTPLAFGQQHVQNLRAVGLDCADIIDVINSSAFFNWANRLMLSLGEPEVPIRFR
ncbi:MAG: alkylhydroperoxidase domain protein [Rothia sp. (in: high G+C Gram-positive bacteria)]|nr:alkylhydroperoxidase domain protein [Rothia sp. (in: high G+C Gram-positive bacteria)]